MIFKLNPIIPIKWRFFLLFLLFLTPIIIHPQDSITSIRYNRNWDAKELKHSLNKTKDSLILECDYIMHKVEIYHPVTRREIPLGSKQATISIRDLELGRHSVDVFTNSKIIMFNILRHLEYPKEPEKTPKEPEKTPKEFKEIHKELTPKEVAKMLDDLKYSKNQAYWIIEEVNSRFGSYSSSFLGKYKKMRYKVIKNMLDIRSFTGKLNVLTVIFLSFNLFYDCSF